MATIDSAERMIRENESFLDLRRRLSAEFPSTRQHVTEMKNYLHLMQTNRQVPEQDVATPDAARVLLDKLDRFLAVSLVVDDVQNSNHEKRLGSYEEEVVSAGTAVFEELARGSVAQLTKQSVLALSTRGVDRLLWAFRVIQNSYLNRDTILRLPVAKRFREYRRDRDALSMVISNYQAFTGAGTTFRNEESATRKRLRLRAPLKKDFVAR